ncbi:MAG: glutamate--tRNA ligase [Hyphomicrobiaceae bacterium]
MTVIVRFAPSPTGRLHIGNIRTAILNWLFAKKQRGTFVLRIDDTDRERSTEAFVDGIHDDLRWLGLSWAREERQSTRLTRYREAADLLKKSGRLYPCYDTEEDLDRRRRLQRASGRPPIYDRTGLHLTAEARRNLEAEGRRPHWRFLLANSDAPRSFEPVPTLVTWIDLVRGDQGIDVGSQSDPVLVREDGTFLYAFTSVVDDIDFAITHVIRGEDHVTNTALQIQLFEALGAAPPTFAHVSLLVDADGQALSKRAGSLPLADLRAAGIEPIAAVAFAALIGTSHAVEPHTSLDALAKLFDFAKLSRTPARFDIAELKTLNGRLLQTLTYEAVAARLAEAGIGGGAAFWHAVRGNVTVLAEARSWWTVVVGPIEPTVEDEAFCKQAAALLPPEPWNEHTWTIWTNAIKAATGRKGRQLFHPLRLALTGRDQGPELKALMPSIGRDRSAGRLLGRKT